MLRIQVPRKPLLGVFFLVLAFGLLVTCTAVASDSENALFVVGAFIAITICLAIGYNITFTSNCLVVSPNEIRVERLPRREVLLTMPRDSVRRIAVRAISIAEGHATRFELVASGTNGESTLMVTGDEAFARAVQRRLESELAGTTDPHGA